MQYAALFTLALLTTAATAQTKPEVLPPLQSYIAQRISEFDQISPERREELRKISGFVAQRKDGDDVVPLTFICTHNSRRSHMSQIWAATAARHYGFDNVETFSGGTECTAFNPRAVRALKEAGFRIDQTTRTGNPVYHVQYASKTPALTCFSKVYNQAPNPDKDFCAVMTCNSADKACPNVSGAAARIAIPFEDPKAFDGTKKEAQMYAERCAQISREMLYVFSQVK